MAKRSVRRVLVMLDYGDGTDGEVFDLTAVVSQMLPVSSFSSADVRLEVHAERDWGNPDRKAPGKLAVSWGGFAGQWVSGATHLDDVVNASLPDGERVQAINKRIERLKKKTDALRHDAMVAKLEQVAAVRAQHPVARVDMSAVPALPEAS